MFRSIRSTAFVLVLAGAAIPLAACSGSATVGEPSNTASSTTTTAPLSVAVHGQAKHIADAIAQVPLRADQRATIEQMAQDAETRMQPARKAREDLVNAIADQVQSGTIDRTALQPKIDAVASAHLAAQPANRAAFEKLHDLLTPEQRVAFVTALQAQHGNHANGPREGMRGRMQKWATDIGLTQDQQDQIHEKIRARFQAHFAGAVAGTDEQKTDAIQDGHMMWQGHEMHAQMKAMLEAFKGDKFSMDQVAPIPQDAKPMAHEFAGHMLGMVEMALPILTADQRTAAAAKLRAQATKLDEEENVEAAPAAQ
jgi:Spy/CpxP family protein refolding chaperone